MIAVALKRALRQLGCPAFVPLGLYLQMKILKLHAAHLMRIAMGLLWVKVQEFLFLNH